MAKKKKARSRNNGIKIPISLVAGMIPGIGKLWEHGTNPGLHGQPNGLLAMGVEGSRIYIGYDPRNGQFNAGWLGMGLLPLIGGGIIHKFVGGRLGINRMIANSGIPVLRV